MTILVTLTCDHMVIVVNGAPGAGKTTLARQLATRLGVRLLEKDAIKERLFDLLGTSGTAWSRALSSAAFEAMFAIARELDQVMLEGNFRSEHRDRLIALDPAPVEVFCYCSTEELSRRLAGRERHPGHHVPTRDEVVAWSEWKPLAIGRVLRVDCEGEVPIGPLVERIQALIPS